MSFATEKAAPISDDRRKPGRAASVLRAVGGGAVLAVLSLAIWWAGRSGLVSLLTIYAAKTNQVAAADAALRLSPNDPDAHFVRGAILESKSVSAAVEEYKQAARARPEDYVLWLSLARAQELKGDVASAIAAASQGVRLAPFYAKPHWLLENILVRAGRNDEGFRELRSAGASDDALLPAIIDLEWQLSGGDADFVKRTLDPKSPESYKALADYFKQRGKVTEAIEMLRAAGPAAEQERRQYLQELISAQTIKEAALLWSIDHPAPTVDQLIDPGFEYESNLDEPGFGWRRENKAAPLSLSLDRLHFVARTEGIVSGGLPYVGVVDVTNNTILGRSNAFSQTRTDWQEYSIDFKSGENSSAVQVVLRREPCGQSACPIFGHLWLDNFSIEKW